MEWIDDEVRIWHGMSGALASLFLKKIPVVSPGDWYLSRTPLSSSTAKDAVRSASPSVDMSPQLKKEFCHFFRATWYCRPRL